MHRDAHLYIVAYDITDQKRWRRVFRIMKGYGQWLQLSIFQCRLTQKQQAELIALLDGVIHHDADHVVLLDLGPSESVDPRVVSLGKAFSSVAQEPVIV